MAKQSYIVKQVGWDSPEAEAARQIRLQVFVDEQKVPAELELDDTDSTALHFIAYDGDQRPCGTARMFPDSDHPSCAHIGRMAVLRDVRGTGCGAAMLSLLISEARKRDFERITLSAQTHAAPFYMRHGFRPEGNIYPEAGIPHQAMSLSFNSADT